MPDIFVSTQDRRHRLSLYFEDIWVSRGENTILPRILSGQQKNETVEQMLLFLVIICHPHISGIYYSLNGLWRRDQRSLIKSLRHIDRTMFGVN